MKDKILFPILIPRLPKLVLEMPYHPKTRWTLIKDFYPLTSHNDTYISDTQDVPKQSSLSAQVETDFDQILKNHPHYTSFAEIGT